MMPFRLRLARTLAAPLPPLVAARVSTRIYPPDKGWADAYAFRARARTGSVYHGTTKDFHAHLFAVHGYYDWRVLAAVRFLLRPGDAAVEVGANVGTETIGLADAVGPTGRVFAFEPVPANAELLRVVVKQAGLAQVEVVQAAVSDTAGTLTFAAPADERETGSGHLATGGAQGYQVECLTLDGFLAGKQPPRLVLIDVEGAEVGVLRGAAETLRAHRPAVIVEAGVTQLKRFGHTLADLEAALSGHGYRLFGLSRYGLSEPRRDRSRGRGTENWLALPPDRAEEAPRLRRHLLLCGLLPSVRFLNPLCRRLT